MTARTGRSWPAEWVRISSSHGILSRMGVEVSRRRSGELGGRADTPAVQPLTICRRQRRRRQQLASRRAHHSRWQRVERQPRGHLLGRRVTIDRHCVHERGDVGWGRPVAPAARPLHAAHQMGTHRSEQRLRRRAACMHGQPEGLHQHRVSVLHPRPEPSRTRYQARPGREATTAASVPRSPHAARSTRHGQGIPSTDAGIGRRNRSLTRIPPTMNSDIPPHSGRCTPVALPTPGHGSSRTHRIVTTR
jgi:hypothetical protein